MTTFTLPAPSSDERRPFFIQGEHHYYVPNDLEPAHVLNSTSEHDRVCIACGDRKDHGRLLCDHCLTIAFTEANQVEHRTCDDLLTRMLEEICQIARDFGELELLPSRWRERLSDVREHIRLSSEPTTRTRVVVCSVCRTAPASVEGRRLMPCGDCRTSGLLRALQGA